MHVFFRSLAIAFLGVSAMEAQVLFNPEIPFDTLVEEVVVSPSPITSQILFIGGHDSVQTTATYGNPAGVTLAKQWHDFIGFTPDNNGQDLGWLSVNHEMILADDRIGDGGGMTVFKIRRNAETDTIEIVSQSLTDGRQGKFFNVDFVNTVGETGMNCGGISSEVDGRIWTAEEWWIADNATINTYFGAGPDVGVRDTSDFTIVSDIEAADGQTIRKFENFNWMVEIDPREAKAIRKQYNWGRQPYEGGTILEDNQTVLLGADNTPGYLTKFVADVPGDFTQGELFVYREHDEQLRVTQSATALHTFSEISAYDPTSQKIYSTSSNDGISIFSFADPKTIDSIGFIDLSAIGSPTSVAVHAGQIAVAIPANTEQDPGAVVVFNESGVQLASFTVGALPDMLTFTPDGNKILVANEGEPNDDYTVDPEGSVSIIDISSGLGNATVHTAGFGHFSLANISPEVRIFGNGTTNVAQDVEPEYIAVNSSSTKAYVALQENNAIAVVDLTLDSIVDILALGYKNYGIPSQGIDASDDDGQIANIQAYNNVYGMYQPDAIAVVEINGNEYIVTANEGDARDYDGYSEEDRVRDVVLDPTAFPNAAFLQEDSVLGRLKITLSQGDIDGDGDYDKLYSYGARSFSIWDTNGNLVFDSGNEFAKIIAERYPENYPDNRDDDKGSEPESIAVGKINGKTFAFIGLERATGVMVYDISDPSQPKFEQYYNYRADRSPEGLVFVDASQSPNGRPYLLSTNEPFGSYSGSLSAYGVYGYDNEQWIPVDNSSLDHMLEYQDRATTMGATMYNRLEWVTVNTSDGMVYLTETGRDKPGSRWRGEYLQGAQIANHHAVRALQQNTEVFSSSYVDYYGRVLQFDPAQNIMKSLVEGGPEYHDQSAVDYAQYPEVHLSNPDGLTTMQINDHPYLVICEDLNGTSHGRMPAGSSNRTCELFLLDLEIQDPTANDLVRIALVPRGAEVTGVKSTPDGKTLFFNVQHPSSSNPFPFNNSLTMALSGWENQPLSNPEIENTTSGFQVYPNPVSRILYLSERTDIALYNAQGALIKVERNVSSIDLQGIESGIYFIQNADREVRKLIVE